MPPDDAREFLRAFGDAVRARRKERGLSQEAFADEIPLYRSYVADVERGARNLGLVNSCESPAPCLSRSRSSWQTPRSA